MNAPTPGWYPDPQDPLRTRYWTGSGWTDHAPPNPPQWVVPAQPRIRDPKLKWWLLLIAAVFAVSIGTAIAVTSETDEPDPQSYRSGKLAGAPIADVPLQLGSASSVEEACTAALQSFKRRGMASDYVDEDWISGCIAGVHDRHNGGNYAP
ncbi:DUF2510 domain-containing protein [Mycolicibacterium fluoranthenivorans]|uniref:DUF2510 domain-containing protein n=1 Tax=Mycolicibacterium fluoranthenivorans TaxID=258505 RepID=A0A7G8P9H0_9MYCO|nr:DUF2510 domain-containing protein [Mycolicibacterium fluoranthenivorans]